MSKGVRFAVVGAVLAALPVWAFAGDAATLARLQAEDAAVAAGSTVQNPQSALQNIAPVGQGSGTVSADLQAVQSDNAQIQSLAKDWRNVQRQAANYAEVASYARLSGVGPRIQTPYGIEQCHNVRWDNQIQQLVTGGLNLAGDAEAEAYAMQAIDTHFVQDVAKLMDAQSGQVMQGASPSNPTVLQTESQRVESAATALNGLLNGLGQQISAALGPNSTLQQLPLANTWHAGIGSYPDLSAVRWVPGPDDGAPIGWYLRYSNVLFPRLLDRCPTGSANIPEIPASTILTAAQQAVADEPALAPLLSGLEGGSVWSLAEVGPFGGGQYAERVQLVHALGYDMSQVSNYMTPINEDVTNFAAQANALTQSLSQ
ncbi:hypothetical protein [Acidithiobacillus sp.]|uniref:hypothetical protein n=1 Tax=Acidithiobacillus sp. TaxID=1872118 RepID=UPI003CFC03A2